MRVLHAVTLHSPSHAFGGPVRVALNLAKGLRARGHEAGLLALGEGFAGPWPTEVEGVPARLFPARRLLPLGFSGMTSPALLASAGRLVRDADLVHVHLARDLVTLPVALAALRAGRPLVLQTHGMVDPSGRLLAKVLDAVAVRRVLRGADAVLYLTAHERAGLDAVVGAPLASAVRLVNGTPAQEERPAPAGPPRVLYAARLQARKRPVDFVDAVPAVLAVHPEARFVVAGPDEGERAAVLRRIAELGLADRVSVPGALGGGEVLRELRGAHVYVLPSVDEPFPMSVLEALSVGVPAVVTHSNGLARDIAAAGAGRAVDPGPAGVAAAVLDLLDPAANRAASVAARELAAGSFSMDAVLDTLLPVYEGALRG
ncbi:glycosyltransferase [Streptomyces subrutilus]|uniref:D-inositol 3-phosphate glycosyltransferase n=1 Tax=Streptomyces subrutilus TaxID=36818 RepID=A0A5P2UPR9_9ACTN|nr:glycosyltransferase [Streptomyces subrutilus]QEU78677.1 glycosyltransferase [Streptomyces subrutilus]WSJ32165.1 glycosyltransferase [Streptomyces subrutilus]GGZ58643.1 glycosyl transferase family 1 [Streptomyces subrutilus]